MLEITCSPSAMLTAGALFTAFSTPFTSSTVPAGEPATIEVRPTEQVVAFSHTTTPTDTAATALDVITAADIEAGERDVREGRWISLAELSRELREQGRELRDQDR